WGQDLPRLRQALEQRGVRELHLVYRGTAAPWLEGLPRYDVLPPSQPTTGWIAVSLMAEREEAAGDAWLDGPQPVQRAGQSIDLYYIAPPAPPTRTANGPAAVRAR